jgi:hypothetical protein
MDKGVMPNPSLNMDIEKVEAMLCNAGLNTKNSRILFQHLNQFFGRAFLNLRRNVVNVSKGRISHLLLTNCSLQIKQIFTTGTRCQMN